MASAAVFLVISILLTPERLCDLGPMRESLQHELDSVRNTARAEVLIARIACGLAAVAMLIAAVFWQRLRRSRFVANVVAHPIVEAPGSDLLFNRSLLIMLPLIAAGLGYVAWAPDMTDRSLRLYREDGPIEQGTALLFLVASVLSFVRLRRFKGRATRSWSLFLGVGFFLCAGEEVSWGQRWFNWTTPEALRDINVQNETNLHNSLGFAADHIFIAGTLAYGALLPLLCRRYEFVKRMCSSLGLPIASLGLAISFLLISGIHDWTVYRVLPKTVLRMPELREFLAACCFVLLMWESLRVVQRKSPTSASDA